MIICNGLPKSGTNLLLRFCGLVGLKNNGIIIRKYSSTMAFGISQFSSSKKKKTISLEESLNFNDTWFCHSHMVYEDYDFIKNHTVITIFRDPRNVIISLIRERFKKFGLNLNQNQEKLLLGLQFCDTLTYLRKFNANWKGTWVDYYRLYLPWLQTSNCLFFEDFLVTDNIKSLATKLSVDIDIDFVQEHLFGNGKILPNGNEAYIERSTWTGKLSNWEDWWSEEIDILWNDIGGQELLDDIESLKKTRR